MNECSARQGLESLLGYRFSDPRRLEDALTHKSFANEFPALAPRHNERLEFLGDAVLDLVVSQYLFEHLAELSEGDMSRIRSEVVSERSLAQIGRNLKLGEYLRLGRGELRSGGRDKASLLANTLEALIGAVFSDGGFEVARRVTLGLFAEDILRSARRKAGIDAKTRLQEHYQGRFGRPPVYQLIGTTGPDHDRLYRIEVLFDGRIIGRGEGSSKKSAEQAAAAAALAVLDQEKNRHE
ncbi:ribonuclease III [Geoalkalibacter sp.]|uniref:ribonuclease III n=1 Tax=Geoalkalibacter sp. TaxID=3041440 RepID=UPI00272EC83A|nr:ribonuclease III [Geoalkalibacter sp.]